MFVFKQFIFIFVEIFKNTAMKRRSENTVIYYKSTLKMVEKIEGTVTRKSFDNLEALIEDRNLLSKYLKENPDSTKINIITL